MAPHQIASQISHPLVAGEEVVKHFIGEFAVSVGACARSSILLFLFLVFNGGGIGSAGFAGGPPTFRDPLSRFTVISASIKGVSKALSFRRCPWYG